MRATWPGAWPGALPGPQCDLCPRKAWPQSLRADKSLGVHTEFLDPQGAWGAGLEPTPRLLPEPLCAPLLCDFVHPYEVLFENNLLQLKIQKSLKLTNLDSSLFVFLVWEAQV